MTTKGRGDVFGALLALSSQPQQRLGVVRRPSGGVVTVYFRSHSYATVLLMFGEKVTTSFNSKNSPGFVCSVWYKQTNKQTNVVDKDHMFHPS